MLHGFVEMFRVGCGFRVVLKELVIERHSKMVMSDFSIKKGRETKKIMQYLLEELPDIYEKSQVQTFAFLYPRSIFKVQKNHQNYPLIAKYFDISHLTAENIPLKGRFKVTDTKLHN